VALGRRPSAAAREKKRRLSISAKGRMTDGVIEDFRDGVLYYSYSVRGVYYTATQNVDGLTEYVPAEAAALAGPATVKYYPANPANSILISENWSGVRAAGRTVMAAGAAAGGSQ
jgi:hypothetical protein